MKFLFSIWLLEVHVGEKEKKSTGWPLWPKGEKLGSVFSRASSYQKPLSSPGSVGSETERLPSRAPAALLWFLQKCVGAAQKQQKELNWSCSLGGLS